MSLKRDFKNQNNSSETAVNNMKGYIDLVDLRATKKFISLKNSTLKNAEGCRFN